MRYIAFFLILAFMISCKNDKPKNIPEVIVQAKLLRSYDTLNINIDTTLHKAFDVEISIINKSSKPVSFWMMTCSWDENFLINNDYIRFIGWDCDGNFPTTKDIKPYGRIVLNASIFKNNFSRYITINSTKFGLIFIDTTSCKNIDDYNNIIGDKSKQNKIIWSNPLYLNDGK